MVVCFVYLIITAIVVVVVVYGLMCVYSSRMGKCE